jgi:hypothetical protein
MAEICQKKGLTSLYFSSQSAILERKGAFMQALVAVPMYSEEDDMLYENPIGDGSEL